MNSLFSTKAVRRIIEFTMGIIVVVVVASFALFMGNKLFGIPNVPVTMEVPYILSAEQISTIENTNILPPDTSIDDDELTLSIPFEKSGRISIIVVLLLLMTAGLIFYSLYLLRSILLSSESGETFTVANAIRLKYLGHLAIFFAIFNTVFGKILTVMSQNIINGTNSFDRNLNFDLGFSFDVKIFIIGLLLYVLARIWKEGINMKEEIELTI